LRVRASESATDVWAVFNRIDNSGNRPVTQGGAPPITLARYEQIKIGMTNFEVREILGGGGDVKTDVSQVDEGKFGYSLLTRYTMTYPGIDASKAVFIFEKYSGNPIKLVDKIQIGLR